MKRKKTVLMTLLVLAIGLAAFAVYRYTFRKAIPETSLALQVKAILENNGCVACHSTNAPLPFYATLPVGGDLVKKDIHDGTRYMDIEKLCNRLQEGSLIPEVDLAKIEQSFLNESMPPVQYTAVHWGTSFNSKEKGILAQWVRDVRTANYARREVAPEFANEPLQPLMDSLPVNPVKVALGFRLYHDTRISADNTVSCATCHPLHTGGVDGLKTSKGIFGQIGGINAPTVYNAALNVLQFWDGRADDLQMQAGGPPLDPLEMGSNWQQITDKFKADPEMVKEFAALYPEGITEKTITDAIAEFEKTLITPDCAFDRYLKGDKNALTEEEIAGYALFKKNNCATCHVGMNIGGQSFEYMGILHDYFADRGTELHAKDMGRVNATKIESDKHRFKTPTLRNVAITAPYLHDGTALTLEDATRQMLKYELNREIPEQDIAQIVTFMKTLTGKNKMMNYVHQP